MRRFGLLIATAAGLLTSTAAMAQDVPLPVRKPKDATGAAAVGDTPLPVRRPHTDAAVGKEATPAGKSAGKGEPGQPGPNPPAKAGASEPAPLKEPPKDLTEWPAEDIELAKARCTVLLKGLDVVSVPEAPFRKNDCGAPAPVRLISIGKSPEVTLDPPAVLTCDMVAAMSRWLDGDLQPLARRHLGGNIIKIENMSDYSCRNAYGRITTKLSEHGRANALDIRGFVTAKGERALVLQGWGRTERDIAAAKAAAQKAAAEAKAAAEKAAADAARAVEEGATDGSKGVAVRDQPSLPTRSTIVEGVPKTFLPPELSGDNKGLGLVPQQLGGPKERGEPPDAASPKERKSAKDEIRARKAGKSAGKKEDSRKSTSGSDAAPILTTKPASAALDPGQGHEPPRHIRGFLREAHAAACRIFGTTLGPEANNAHRNHFHVDMAPRKHKRICD